MAASFSERSPLLQSRPISRRTRLLVSGLALLLLLAGAVSCVAIVLRLLHGAPASGITTLVLEEEVKTRSLWLAT
jgi:hypothetical protein